MVVVGRDERSRLRRPAPCVRLPLLAERIVPAQDEGCVEGGGRVHTGQNMLWVGSWYGCGKRRTGGVGQRTAEQGSASAAQAKGRVGAHHCWGRGFGLS